MIDIQKTFEQLRTRKLVLQQCRDALIGIPSDERTLVLSELLFFELGGEEGDLVVAGLHAKPRKKPGPKPVAKRLTCAAAECDLPVHANHLCSKHYAGSRRAKATPAKRKENAKTCSVTGCDRPFVAKGMCMRHYAQARAKTARPVTQKSPSRKAKSDEEEPGNPAPPEVTKQPPPTAIAPVRPPSLADVPVSVPKVEAVHGRAPSSGSKITSQDEADDFAARERVCESCVKPGEKRLGKSLSALRPACARCGVPTVDAVMVRSSRRHAGKLVNRNAKRCKCGLTVTERKKTKHVCPEAA